MAPLKRSGNLTLCGGCARPKRAHGLCGHGAMRRREGEAEEGAAIGMVRYGDRAAVAAMIE